MTRVADAGNEAYLLNIALCGTASHVEDVVRGYRRALDAAELTREAVQQRDQHLWFHTEPDGSMAIRGRVPAEVGALFKRALRGGGGQPADPGKRFRPERFRRAKSCIAPGSAGSRRWPRWPRASWRPVRGISPDRTASRSWCMWMPRPSSTLMPVAASWNMARRSLRRLRDASPATAAWCGSSRTRRASRWMSGRKTRTIPPGIRRALQARDKGCRFPGCTFKRYVDGHHVKHWVEWRGDEALEPRHPVPLPPPAGA